MVYSVAMCCVSHYNICETICPIPCSLSQLHFSRIVWSWWVLIVCHFAQVFLPTYDFGTAFLDQRGCVFACASCGLYLLRTAFNTALIVGLVTGYSLTAFVKTLMQIIRFLNHWLHWGSRLRKCTHISFLPLVTMFFISV